MLNDRIVIGLDLYNQSTTGDVSKTLNNKAVDADHIPCVLIYDARGNGGGGICPTITGDHQNRITDYTAIVIQKSDSSSGSEMKSASPSEPNRPHMGG